MINDHHDMIQAVIDMVKSTQAYLPMGNHPSLQKSWWSENEFILSDHLNEASSTYKQKTQAERALSLIADAYAQFLNRATNPAWSALMIEQRKAKVERLKDLPQIAQRSREWYLNFAKVLTASEFSSLFGSPRQRRTLALTKAKPKIDENTTFRTACPTDEMSPVSWGIRFEPVVKQILEHTFHCKIFEPGRITHPDKPRLAASADGIFEESEDPNQVGRLVEIKCPYTRAIGGEIPIDYWIQMQIQMEVTDIDECEYCEVEILSRRSLKPPPDLSGTSLQGMLYLIKQAVADGQPFDYKYLYGDIGSNVVPPIPDGYELMETIPWAFKKWHHKIVQRDRTWYAATEAWQDAFWADVDAARKGEELTFGMATEPMPAPTPCLIQDD